MKSRNLPSKANLRSATQVDRPTELTLPELIDPRFKKSCEHREIVAACRQCMTYVSGVRNSLKMRFLQHQEFDRDQSDIVFKTSRLIMIVPTGVLLATKLSLLAGLFAGVLDAFYWGLVALLGCLAVVFFFFQFLPTLSSDNGVLLGRGKKILIPLHHDRHQDVADRPSSLLELDLADIAAARQFTRHVEGPGTERDETIRWRERFLEFEVPQTICDQVREMISRSDRPSTESSRSSSRRQRISNVSTEGGLLRVLWNGRYRSIRPGLRKTLLILREHGLKVADPSEEQLRPLEIEADGTDQDLQKLVQTGERMTAIKILREKLGMSISEARSHLDRLQGRLAERQT